MVFLAVDEFAFPGFLEGSAGWFLGPLAGACALGAVVRSFSVAHVLRTGVRTKATVTRVLLWRDRGRIDFEFDAGGTPAAASNMIHQTRRVKALVTGQTVDIAYVPNRPKQAYIADIFC